jgi:hypothetical protein
MITIEKKSMNFAISDYLKKISTPKEVERLEKALINIQNSSAEYLAQLDVGQKAAERRLRYKRYND